MSYQEAKNRGFAAVYKNDPKAESAFAVGDVISTDKEGIGEVVGEVVAVSGQQLTCSWEHGTFYAWSWQSRRVEG